MAVEVVRLIKEIVAGAKFTSFAQLVDHIAEVGQVLQDAGPKGELESKKDANFGYGILQS